MNRPLTQYQKRRLFNDDDRELFRKAIKLAMHGELLPPARLLYWWLHNEGWRFSPSQLIERYESRRFDSKYGTDTSARVNIKDMDLVSNNGEHGVYYQATPVTSFRTVLRRLDLNFPEYSFVDFGSGKGRTLVLAAQLPFHEVIGVEFCQKLSSTANANIKKLCNKKAASARSQCIDATEFIFPSTNLVLYFFNPFDAKILSKVINNLIRTLTTEERRVIIIYRYLPDRSIFLKNENFRLVADWRRYTIFEWQSTSALSKTGDLQ